MQVATDGSHSYLACSYSSRCICIYDYVTGEMVAQARGHSAVVTGIIFLPDCKHLVSVSSFFFLFFPFNYSLVVLVIWPSQFERASYSNAQTADILKMDNWL